MVFLARSSRSAFLAGKTIPLRECVTFATDPPLCFALVVPALPFAIPPSDCSLFIGKKNSRIEWVQCLAVRDRSRVSPRFRPDVALVHKRV
jgi:hypothetical protein